jgi:DNA-binding LytR/AlgR family response regulator
MRVDIAVCEDEANIREEIAGFIQSRDLNRGLELYESADALLKSGKSYDVYILDIQMPGLSGMELAKKIRDEQSYPGPVIVFLTALREQMQDAFDVQAYNFLTKPVDENRFSAVLAGAIAESARRNRREHIVVKRGGMSHTVPLCEILFVESVRKQVLIYTKAGLLEVYGKISELAEALEASEMFFRCNRCYIVNMAHIASFTANAVVLKNGRDVFLSREKYPDFVKAYAQYAMK